MNDEIPFEDGVVEIWESHEGGRKGEEGEEKEYVKEEAGRRGMGRRK